MVGSKFGRTLRADLDERQIKHEAFAYVVGISPGYLSKLVLRSGINLSSEVLVSIVFAFEQLGAPLAEVELRQLLRARFDDMRLANERAA